MSLFTGTFKLTKSENFDEYMKALGVNLLLRQMASTAEPTTMITQDGDTYKIVTSAGFKTTEIKFKLGEEFDEVTADGRNCKSVITQGGDNNMLIHVQECNGQLLKILREFTDTGMKMVLEAPGNVICTRYYDKIAGWTEHEYGISF